MAADTVQVSYEELEQIIRWFESCADDTHALIRRVENQINTLESGGWIGIGADKFYAEIYDLVLPGVYRLMDALNEAGNTTHELHDLYASAEEDAGNLIGRGDGDSSYTPPIGNIGTTPTNPVTPSDPVSSLVPPINIPNIDISDHFNPNPNTPDIPDNSGFAGGGGGGGFAPGNVPGNGGGIGQTPGFDPSTMNAPGGGGGFGGGGGAGALSPSNNLPQLGENVTLKEATEKMKGVTEGEFSNMAQDAKQPGGGSAGSAASGANQGGASSKQLFGEASSQVSRSFNEMKGAVEEIASVVTGIF